MVMAAVRSGCGRRGRQRCPSIGNPRPAHLRTVSALTPEGLRRAAWSGTTADGVVQARSLNEAKEITDLDGDTSDVAFDAAGNMTTVPQTTASALWWAAVKGVQWRGDAVKQMPATIQRLDSVMMRAAESASMKLALSAWHAMEASMPSATWEQTWSFRAGEAVGTWDAAAGMVTNVADLVVDGLPYVLADLYATQAWISTGDKRFLDQSCRYEALNAIRLDRSFGRLGDKRGPTNLFSRQKDERVALAKAMVDQYVLDGQLDETKWDAGMVIGGLKTQVTATTFMLAWKMGLFKSAKSIAAARAAGKGATPGGGPIASRGRVTSGPRQTMATGREWYDALVQRYSAQNVEWVGGAGRTIRWPSELPRPHAGVRLFQVRPPARSSTFVRELSEATGPRPAHHVAHHRQFLQLNGLDDGALNGVWVLDELHMAGHGKLTPIINRTPYGTEFIIMPGVGGL